MYYGFLLVEKIVRAERDSVQLDDSGCALDGGVSTIAAVSRVFLSVMRLRELVG